MRIDFHVHLALREQLLRDSAAFCDSFWAKRGDWNSHVRNAESLDSYLEAEGVDYAVGLAEVSPGVTGITTNEYVHETFAASEKIILFGTLNPESHTDLKGEVKRLSKLGFRGIKLYPTYQFFYPNDPRLYPLYEGCAEEGWPVMVHTGSSIFSGAKMKYGQPLLLDEVAVDFPEVNLLIVHGGRGLWYDQAAFLAGFRENLYLEISGLPPRNLLKYFPNLNELKGKVIFGSDWPGNPGIRANMDAVASLPLDKEMIVGVLGGTAARLLGLAA